MTGQDYTSSITANITAQQATERINDVAGWWTASVTGASAKVGDAFTVRWGETFVDFTVAELNPGERVAWLVTDCNLTFVEDMKEWKDTRVVFDISSHGNETTVKMTHAGLAPGVECYSACEKGWNFYILESLQNLLDENQGFPDMRGKRESAEKVAAGA